MSARGSANLLTRTTAILGTLFMATAIALTIVSQIDRSSTSILDRAVQNPDGSPASVRSGQLRAMASTRASVVLPTPRGPQKR